MVNITLCTEPTELFRQYHGQNEPQPAYIQLDTEAGTLHADYDAEIGNAVPASVWHGIDRRYRIPILTADAANRVMEEIAPLADRIVAGTTTEWDGNNHVAVMDDDAIAAEEELEEALGNGPSSRGASVFSESDVVAVWDIDGAVNGSEADDYDITPDTTDERLEEIANDILSNLADCAESDVAVCDGLLPYLKEKRQEVIDEAAELDD
ncbi:hypothetical protein [Streptomyces sp. NPDC008150]|uniref:hypothetical protein n=1 Tax=Streptomyces sp. NPDC008150 TaxID=3364816 RepID=UPI0036E4AE39